MLGSGCSSKSEFVTLRRVVVRQPFLGGNEAREEHFVCVEPCPQHVGIKAEGLGADFVRRAIAAVVADADSLG